MLLSQMLAVTLSLSAHAATLDPVDTTRGAFNNCLRAFVTSGIASHKSVNEIRSGLGGQCATEEAAYRAAMVRSDVAARVPQAEAERNATQEITDSRENARQSIQDSEPH